MHQGKALLTVVFLNVARLKSLNMSSRRDSLRTRRSTTTEKTPVPRRTGLRNRSTPVVKENEVKKKLSLETSDDECSEQDELKDFQTSASLDNTTEEAELDSQSDDEPIIKARVLTDDLDSVGHSIYGFKTPKRKEAIAKAANSVQRFPLNSSRQSKTPSDKKSVESSLDDKKQKKKTLLHIHAVNMNNNNIDESDDDSSHTSSEESEDEDSGGTDHKENHDLLDEYFQVHHTSHKSITSDKTLAKLSNPKMQQDELKHHLKDVQSSHINETVRLHCEKTLLFDKWMFQLLCGFNILLYGFGSKRDLLEQFRTHCLKKCWHLVINGFFPNITVKQILNLITEDILCKDISFKNISDQYTFIKNEFNADIKSRLFLLVHNIDGQMLRSQNAQSALGHLASAKNIHVIASIDHINAPLIWDQNKSSQFNWLWYDCTTFEPYSEETSYENSMLVQQSGTLALSSLTHVLRSLTPNACGIFKLLANCQLDNEDNTSYQGLSFTELYSKCRERFLVNSDLTLRAQLTEFKDHKLIKTKKGFDGVEYLSVALDISTIKQYMENDNT